MLRLRLRQASLCPHTSGTQHWRPRIAHQQGGDVGRWATGRACSDKRSLLRTFRSASRHTDLADHTTDALASHPLPCARSYSRNNSKTSVASSYPLRLAATPTFEFKPRPVSAVRLERVVGAHLSVFQRCSTLKYQTS